MPTTVGKATEFITFSRGSLATVTDSNGLIKWAPHNFVLNSASPVTQSITTIVGAKYKVEMTGSGSVALSGAGSGTVTTGVPVEITASTTTLTLTCSGTVSTMWAYRSDLGGMQLNGAGTTYNASTGSAYHGPRLDYDPVTLAAKGLLVEEARTNLYLNSETPATQVATLTSGSTYTISMTGGSNVVDLDETIAVTAVDVFVYDTSKDSDGGAWATSYPAMMVIVAEASSVKIYDATDTNLPLHSTLDFTGYTVKAVSALEGVLSVATTTGLATLNIADGDTTIGLDYTTSTSPAIVNNACNDVAMTVLSGAPTDPATGLKVPTIAVATDGGVSVITDSGAVYDSLDTAPMFRCAFKGSDLVYARTSADHLTFIAFANDYSAADGFGDVFGSTSGSFGAVDMLVRPNEIAFDNSEWFFGGKGGATGLAKDGLMSLVLDETNNANSMSALITSTYATGWMNGDIKGAFLSDTSATNLVGGTDADRSVNGNDLTVNGTITRTAVASGADLVAYSGFSASNYLEQPYNSDLDFGTGDFAIIGWIKQAANSAIETILERDSAVSAQRFTIAVDASGFLTFTCDDDTTARTATSTVAIDNNVWTHFVALYDGAGALKIYLNGALNDTETGSALLTLNNASAVLRIGLAVDDGEPLTNASLALMRISATVPTADQILKIYNDEKVLFQTNAKATLYGASDAVTALSHDPDTDLLHVGTSAGRSVFQGLRRISNTTTAVSTAISANNGVIAEQ